MTPQRLARILLLLLAWVVLLASGAYLLVYLYRWEWNRAVISGIFFIAAEVALASASLGRRTGRLEARVERIEGSLREPAHRPGGRPSAPEEPAGAGEAEGGDRPFPWLEPGSLSVFVPVLLGVGAILSGMAYVVERIARGVDPWGAERSVERRLANLQPPASLLPGEEAGVAIASTAPVRARELGTRRSWIAVAASLAVVTLAVWVVVIQIAELTENRPDVVTGGRSAYDLVIQTRGEPAPVLSVARTLLATCRPMASPWSTFRLSEVGGSTVRMTVTPSLPENAERRFIGCLADLQLDRVLVSIEDPGDGIPAA
ncbi:MAG TPA: hypothetical protein VIE12_08270 [Actinomycetota bacterium]|jgi:hypothetical protein